MRLFSLPVCFFQVGSSMAPPVGSSVDQLYWFSNAAARTALRSGNTRERLRQGVAEGGGVCPPPPPPPPHRRSRNKATSSARAVVCFSF